MDDLIEALKIFRTVANPYAPLHCEHDTLYIMGISKEDLTQENIDTLENLGFYWDDAEEVFYSFRFGSA